MMQHLGIYADGWFAGTTPLGMPWETSQRRGATAGDQRSWELYDLRNDFSQSRNLARQRPDKLEALQQLFWQEAERNRMLPIHSSYGSAQAGRPSLAADRNVFDYGVGTVRVSQDAAPPTVGRSFKISADIVVPETNADGVIVAQGGRYSGYSLYVHDGSLRFHYNAVPPLRATVAATERLAPGPRKVEFVFAADAPKPGTGGVGRLVVDGRTVAEGRIDATVGRWVSHTEGLDVGSDTITPVSDDYDSPARFTGRVERVRFWMDPTP